MVFCLCRSLLKIINDSNDNNNSRRSSSIKQQLYDSPTVKDALFFITDKSITKNCQRRKPYQRGEEQNREEGEMAQKKLEGGRKSEVNV